MTNATKANIIGVLNAGLGLGVLFGLPLSEAQVGGISLFGNAIGVLIVGLTYKNSQKRIPGE